MTPEIQKEIVALGTAALQIDVAMKQLKKKKELIYAAMITKMGKERNVKTSAFTAYTNSKATAKLKEGVDVSKVLASYPDAVKVDAKKLYEIAEKPEQYVDMVNGEVFLTVKAVTKKEAKAQDN